MSKDSSYRTVVGYISSIKHLFINMLNISIKHNKTLSLCLYESTYTALNESLVTNIALGFTLCYAHVCHSDFIARYMHVSYKLVAVL